MKQRISLQHMFSTAPLGTWVRLLSENRGVSRPYWGKMAIILMVSALTTPLRLVERVCYGHRVAKTPIDKPPLIILGYGRSGTTHLHNLLAHDPNHGSVTTFQALAPTFSLIGRGWLKRLLARNVPSKRPMDNVAVSLDLPQEEEIAFANTTHLSYLHHLSFPKQTKAYFEKYVMMRGLTDEELAAWDRVCLDTVCKATLHANGRRIVLKNPINLARIPHLLRLFPKAKFIHIMRNPYVVYPSIMRMYRVLLSSYQLDIFAWEEMENLFERNYVLMMQQYMQDRALLPKENFAEVRFEALEQDPISELERLYTELALPDWERAKKPIEDYLQTLSGYRKNRHQLDSSIIERVNQKWRFAVDAWNYQPPDASG